MKGAPWAIIVDGGSAVTERKLGDHQAGQLLKPSVAVEETKVVGDVRSATRLGFGNDFESFIHMTAWKMSRQPTNMGRRV